MRKLGYFAILSVAGIALASCQSPGTRGPDLSLAKPAPTTNTDGLNGQWIPTDEAAKGVYVATFRDNVFVSKSPTNGKILAKGSYTSASDTLVKLTFEGAATKTVVNADCQRTAPEKLYCVPSIGSPFNLQKVV